MLSLEHVQYRSFCTKTVNTVTQRDVRGHKRMLSLILSFALAFVSLISANAFDEKKSLNTINHSV